MLSKFSWFHSQLLVFWPFRQFSTLKINLPLNFQTIHETFYNQNLSIKMCCRHMGVSNFMCVASPKRFYKPNCLLWNMELLGGIAGIKFQESTRDLSLVFHKIWPLWELYNWFCYHRSRVFAKPRKLGDVWVTVVSGHFKILLVFSLEWKFMSWLQTTLKAPK